MLTRNSFLFIIVIIVLISIVQFFVFPNLYSTLILCLIIVLLLLACLHIIGEEKRKKNEADYFHLIIHELKNPLSAIKLSLGMLIGGNFGTLNSEQVDILTETAKKNETLIHLIDDLMDYSKAEFNNKYHKTLTDMVGIIDKVIHQSQKEISAKHINFHFDKPKQVLAQIMVDKSKIGVAVQNLIDNALHYTPMHGKIVVGIEQDRGYFNFTISDSGIGIPEDQKSKVFDKFFRATNAIKTEVPGSGLGLFITKKIVAGHGGKIWFTSKEHDGSTFYFKIPIT